MRKKAFLMIMIFFLARPVFSQAECRQLMSPNAVGGFESNLEFWTNENDVDI